MTLAESTSKQIEQMIMNKEFDSNNYLPSEGELSKKFGVSRVTVREAVKSLETRGYLQRIHGKGLLVLDNSIQALTRSISDVINMGDCSNDEIMETRAIIEEACARYAALRATEEDLQILDDACQGMEKSSIMDDGYHSFDLQFHLQLVRSSKNRLLIALVEAYTPLLKKHIISASQKDYCIEATYHYHRNIYNAILARDSDLAAENMRIHLNATEQNQLEMQ